MEAVINFILTPSHNFVFSCDVNISSNLLIIEMHQQGSQFFIVSERASMARHANQKLKAHTIVQFHVAGKLFVQYVNYVNKCWKLDSIARSLFSIRVHVPCTKLYSTVPNICLFTNFKWAYFRVQIHSFCFLCSHSLKSLERQILQSIFKNRGSSAQPHGRLRPVVAPY